MSTSFSSLVHLSLNNDGTAAQRPSAAAPGSSGPTAMDQDIPPELYDQFAQDGGAASGGIKICPHCTFENTHGGSDCEVCGLPL